MSSYINKEETTIKKHYIIYLFLIVTLLIPKAGITTSILPITVATLVYIISIISNFFEYFSLKISFQYVIIYLYLIMSSLITTILNAQYLSAMNIAYMLILLASPMTFLFGRSLDSKKTDKIISYILIIIGIYSILQFMIGVQETAIKGITIAIGDDFSRKQIIRSGWVAKIPSTYTNGTLLAPSLIMLISYVLEIKKKKKVSYLAIIFGIISLLLSGSRSTLLMAVLIIPFLFYRIFTKNSRFIILLLFLPILVVISFIALAKFSPEFINQVYNSYIGFTKTDLTFSGRTVQWYDFIQNIKNLDISGLVRFLFVGLPWNVGKHLEGLPLIMKLYGVLPFFIYTFWTVKIFLKFQRKIYISYSLIVLMLVFMIDGSVLYPPTLMNVYLILGITYNLLEEKET